MQQLNLFDFENEAKEPQDIINDGGSVLQKLTQNANNQLYTIYTVTIKIVSAVVVSKLIKPPKIIKGVT